MAEKKFFVDINLQGNALTNATIGNHDDLTKAGSFGFDGTRLKYSNGTTIQDVANLSDIAAVTGGLIFQGGYDPTTDTPDITGTPNQKGFFWVETVAGSFQGESVQVGDSLVAKIDNATILADWLILQGNIVIATDSVDGISRLATQTEANTGTEGGAVVITPATLQGKIDAQITPEISNKLPLAGGTMTGGINMAGNELNIGVGGSLIVATGATEIYFGDQRVNGIGTPASDDDAANKGYVDDQDALKLSLTGGVMSGGINMAGNVVDNVSALTVDQIQGIGIAGTVKLKSDFDGESTKTIINLPAPTNGGDATNKTYVDDNTSNKLPLAGGTMSGAIDMGGFNIEEADVIEANRVIVLAPANGSDATNKTYVDNADALKLDLAGGTMSGNIDFNEQATIVNVPTPLEPGDAANRQFVVDSKSEAINAAAAYTNQEISILDAAKLSLTGGTMTGNINMNGNEIIMDNGIIEGAMEVWVSSLKGKGGASDDIYLGSNLDANSKSIYNLPAPTNGGDAANKTYVDGAVNSTSYSTVIVSADWTLRGFDNAYYVTINHNLGSYPLFSAWAGGTSADFTLDSSSPNSGSTTILSNILPTENITISFVKANGNGGL